MDVWERKRGGEEERKRGGEEESVCLRMHEAAGDVQPFGMYCSCAPRVCVKKSIKNE